MDKKQRISDFINGLSEKESNSFLLPTSSVVGGINKNGGDCGNSDFSCEGSINGGDCSNFGYCDKSTNKGSCKNYPDLAVNNPYIGCAG